MKRNVWLAAVALTACGSYANAASLMIVVSDADPPVAELSGGFFDVVDSFDAQNDTPTLGELTPFDAVLAYTNFVPQDATALGNVLADYVDAGGRVVVATYGMSLPWAILGRIQDPGYNPFDSAVNGGVSGLLNAVVPGDRVFSSPNDIDVGAVQYFNNSNFAQPTLDGGATLLADDGAGVNMFAVNAAGNVGGLNMFCSVRPENNAEFYEFLENTLARLFPPGTSGDYYLTNGDSTILQVVNGATIDRSWSTASLLYPLAVVETARVYNRGAGAKDPGIEYQLDGTPTGTTYPWAPGPTGQLLDGGTDGTSRNFAAEFAGGMGVWRYDRNWANPVQLFTRNVSIIGVTFDLINGRLWISLDGGNIQQVANDGTVISEFDPGPGRWGALAWEPETDTLWAHLNSTNTLRQWAKDGTLLQEVAVAGLSGNIWGGEFQTCATLEETFPDPLGGWNSRWLYLNSNLESYYVAAGNCDIDNRGNNPTGLWIADTQGCGTGVGGTTSEIIFDPAFGAQITSIEFGLEPFVMATLTFFDMSNNVISQTVVSGGNFPLDHTLTVSATSNNGVSRFLFDSGPHGGGSIEGNTSIDNVRVAICELPSNCPWDLNGDGFVGINDLLILLAAWGPNPGHPADFNGDGFVGIGDLLALLANWGNCPIPDPTGACCVGGGLCSITTESSCGGSWVAGATCADSDLDRIPNAFERDDCSPASGCFVGTDPFNPDTDGDGIDDGDEVFGTTGGVDLPAMGADALHKDIFVEADWMEESEGGSQHSHRPSAAAANLLIGAFAAASNVQNPCGTTGVAFHIDRGQGGPFTGGNFIGNDTVVVFDSEFNTYKAAHFDPDRQGYFHYSIHCHRYNSADNNSSGIAELPGDDFIVSLQTFLSDSNVSKTTMHELGHNLDLRHGGFENLNFKPNYNSIMNYRYQFPGADVNCDALGDGTLDYSSNLNITLNENSLSEAAGVCGATPIDWNGNSIIDVNPISWNINCVAGVTTNCGDDAGGACWDPTCDVLADFNDWTGMVIPIPPSDLVWEIVTCQDTPASP
ncbi:MAG: hypothetical protein ACYS0G_12605 [Planctomycetota bacterium]